MVNYSEIILNETESRKIHFDNISFSTESIDSTWSRKWKAGETFLSILKDGSIKMIDEDKRENLSYEDICNQVPLAKYLIIFSRVGLSAWVFKIEKLEEEKSAPKLEEMPRSKQIQQIENWINKN